MNIQKEEEERKDIIERGVMKSFLKEEELELSFGKQNLANEKIDRKETFQSEQNLVQRHGSIKKKMCIWKNNSV